MNQHVLNQRGSSTPKSSLLTAGLLVLVLALLFAACGSTIQESAATPVGGTWSLQAGSGPEGDIALIDGFPITITFADAGRFGGTAACNGYGGTYQTNNDRVDFGEFGSNQMGCQNDVQASEAAFLAALLDVDAMAIVEGDLSLSGPSTSLVFSSTPDAPIGSVADRTWLLEAMLANDVPTAVEGTPATLHVRSDGSFVASTGCRNLSGRYIVFGSEINFNEMRADGECPASLAAQDSFVVTVLGDGFSADVNGDRLLLSSAGSQGLRYREIAEGSADQLAVTQVVTDQESLIGVEWVLVGGGDAENTGSDSGWADLSAIASVTLTFLEDSYEGVAVCNRYGGSADIGVSLQSVSLGIAEGEQEGCGGSFDGPANPIELYLAALPQMTEGGIEGGGNLTLNGNGIELHFERAN